MASQAHKTNGNYEVFDEQFTIERLYASGNPLYFIHPFCFYHSSKTTSNSREKPHRDCKIDYRNCQKPVSLNQI
jgi:hypothetical protein